MTTDKPRIGVLTYDLQPFTEDCLYRLQATNRFRVKAYPVLSHEKQSAARIDHLPSQKRGKYVNLNDAGSTPEGFISNVNFKAGWRCSVESDVVVLFGLQGATALWTVSLASLRNQPVISVNQTLPPEWERRRRWWVRFSKSWILGRCSRHIYQYPIAKDVLSAVYGCAQDRLYFAPFESGAAWFKRRLGAQASGIGRARTKLGLQNRIVFLFVGTLHAFKGIPEIIAALGTLGRNEDVVCVFAGPEREAPNGSGTIDFYLKSARDLGVERQVKFLGALSPESLAGLYLDSDVVMLPSRRETFGKTLVEGALAGKPLITTSACGAAGCVVRDGQNGFVIEPGNSLQLKNSMAKLLYAERRKQMGRESLMIVDAFCNPESETEGFVAAIEAALRDRS